MSIATLCPVQEGKAPIHNGEDLRKLIKARRTELGFSQREVARRAQLAQKTVSRIESGKDNSSMESVFCLLNALCVQLSWEAN